MNKQEFFDKVARHLLTQNAKSIEAFERNAKCLYRGPNGMKCVAGCLIPDELYSENFEL